MVVRQATIWLCPRWSEQVGRLGFCTIIENRIGNLTKTVAITEFCILNLDLRFGVQVLCFDGLAHEGAQRLEFDASLGKSESDVVPFLEGASRALSAPAWHRAQKVVEGFTILKASDCFSSSVGSRGRGVTSIVRV